MHSETVQPFRPSMETRARVSALRPRLERGAVTAGVVGVGASGQAAADLLEARGCDVRLFDDRVPAELGDDVRSWLGERAVQPIARRGLAEVDLVVLSPGVPRARPELAASIAAGCLVGEVELASWLVSIPLAGITGTNGKSTTTALVAHMLRQGGRRVFAGGNLGEPLSRLALAPGDHDLAIVELSSYQLESVVEAQFRVACWLNLSSDHTDRYDSAAAYASAKRRLIERRSIGGCAVLNARDPVCNRAGLELGGATRWFSTSPSSGLARRAGTRLGEGGDGLREGEDGEERYDLASPALLGVHNKANALAAIECARMLGAAPGEVQAGLSSFRGLPHRLELVATVRGVRYYDDSKATNVESAATAVDAVSGPIHLIAGGRDKGGSWAPLVARADERIVAVYAIGEATAVVERAFSGFRTKVVRAEVLERAVELAASAARPGEVVLLAPACASWDQYKNYAERGAAFAARVGAIGEAG